MAKHNIFLRELPTINSTLRSAVICVLGRGQSSYAAILLVWPLGSLTIAKFNGVGVHCFVQLYAYTTFEYVVRILMHVTVTSNCSEHLTSRNKCYEAKGK